MRIVSDQDIRLDVSTLPRTWAFVNGHQKSLAVFNKMNDQILEDNPSYKQTFQDFKIFFDDTHEQAGWAGNLLPAGYLTTLPTAEYEWYYSLITIPYANAPGTGPANFHLIAIGDDTPSAKAIIKGYADSRARPSSDDPNHPVDTSWMIDVFDVGESLDALEAAIDQDGDSPPYLVGTDDGEEEYYPGGANTAQSYTHYQISRTHIRSGQLAGRGTTPGFTALCGLIRVVILNQGTGEPPLPATVDLYLDLVPGNYKGYAALEMGEVN